MSSQTDEKWISPAKAALMLVGVVLFVVAFWVGVGAVVVMLLP